MCQKPRADTGRTYSSRRPPNNVTPKPVRGCRPSSIYHVILFRCCLCRLREGQTSKHTTTTLEMLPGKDQTPPAAREVVGWKAVGNFLKVHRQDIYSYHSSTTVVPGSIRITRHRYNDHNCQRGMFKREKNIYILVSSCHEAKQPDNTDARKHERTMKRRGKNILHSKA